MRENLIKTSLVCLIIASIYACSDSNTLSGNDTVPQVNNSTNIEASVAGGGGNMQFVLTPMGVHDANNNSMSIQNIQEPEQIQVSSSLSQPDPQTTVVTASASGIDSEPEEFTVNSDNIAARHMVTEVTYSSGATIDYTADNQQKTAALNQKQEDLLSEMHQKLSDAKASYNNMPPATNTTNPLMSKTDQQIKSMLEAKGFTVTIIGDKQFQLEKTDGDIMTTRTFDAETFTASDYEVGYQKDDEYSRYFSGGSIHTVQTMNQ